MRILSTFAALFCFSLMAFAAEVPANSGTMDPAAEQQLAQWDRWQMLMEASERCPIMAPYMRWGIAAQMNYMTDRQSPLGRVLAEEAVRTYGPGEAAEARYRAEFFDARGAQVKALFRDRKCSDPELQNMALEAQPIARFGLYEKLYVFTKVKGGFCAPPDVAQAFAPALAQDMNRIAQTLPETSALKRQVDELTPQAIEDHCIGSGEMRMPTDPMTGNILYDFMSDVEQRQNGYPYELILPLVPTSQEAPSYMAWRARQGHADSEVAAGLLATAVCLQPLEKFRDNGTGRGLTKGIDLYFGVDRDGNLVAQIGADAPLGITEVMLDVANSGSIPASREEAPIAATSKARARAAKPGQLKRYVFDRVLINPVIGSHKPVSVRFKNTFESQEAVWTASGCGFDLGELYQAYGWATEPSGIGEVIE